MAGWLLGQLLVMGSAVVGRAVVQAYRQTIVRCAGRSALVQGKINTMTVKDNLLAASGFHGELICNVSHSRSISRSVASPVPPSLTALPRMRRRAGPAHLLLDCRAPGEPSADCDAAVSDVVQGTPV
uniref:Uncharacterized protein n=1 Tax=Triticum urartu TaxID=4572 RepID=A0A8R7Q472_TRIUA